MKSIIKQLEEAITLADIFEVVKGGSLEEYRQEPRWSHAGDGQPGKPS
jgi:hypothetical protein